MQFFYYCFIFAAAKERFPEILVELDLGLCVTIESFLYTYYPRGSDNMKYENVHQILCHAISLRRFRHPWNMELATGLG